MGKYKRKTSATPANVSRSSRCKTTRRQRLAFRAEQRAIQDGADKNADCKKYPCEQDDYGESCIGYYS